MLFAQLIVATGMIVLTVAMHLAGLTGLLAMMRAGSQGLRADQTWLQRGLVMAAVLGLFALHTLQIWLYAGLYVALGQFERFEAALYFSTSTFTTVGYGDVVLDERWRVLSAIQSANGFLLLGWSTAFLISVVARLRAAEFDWLERREERADLFAARDRRD